MKTGLTGTSNLKHREVSTVYRLSAAVPKVPARTKPFITLKPYKLIYPFSKRVQSLIFMWVLSFVLFGVEPFKH